MKTSRFVAVISGSLLAAALAAAASDLPQAVRDFSADRHRLVQDLSTRLNLPLPPEAESFFVAARTGDWSAVSNRYAGLRAGDPCHPMPESLQNELWAPIHETFGLYEVWAGLQENPALVELFSAPVLDAMPAGAIYFGGTDAGRFLVNAANALRNPPPIFCLTQNGLADSFYMAHLRAIHGDRIWLPSKEDSNATFKQYVDDVKAGRLPAGAEINIKDGQVEVQGVAGVMIINGMLARMIFDRNKDAHPFFVEESYVINWMYPYLEPHGLILKLNPEPVPELSPEVIARDRQFWDEYEARLLATPGFADNDAASKMFSKLRAAGAGIYAYRKLDAEAEAAFRQAIRLWPASPEANYRLADLFVTRQRLPEAIRVVEDLLAASPPEEVERARNYLRQLQSLQKQKQAPDEPAEPPAAPPPSEE